MQIQRKAISPVLATVILIAITLVAAVAIAGFVFGLFSSFTNTAQIQASVTSCVVSGSGSTTLTCSLLLTNSGNAATQATAVCSMNVAGQAQSGAFSNTTPVTPAGNQAGTCSATFASAIPLGATVSGYVIMANGANPLFAGQTS